MLLSPVLAVLAGGLAASWTGSSFFLLVRECLAGSFFFLLSGHGYQAGDRSPFFQDILIFHFKTTASGRRLTSVFMLDFKQVHGKLLKPSKTTGGSIIGSSRWRQGRSRSVNFHPHAPLVLSKMSRSHPKPSHNMMSLKRCYSMLGHHLLLPLVQHLSRPERSPSPRSFRDVGTQYEL